MTVNEILAECIGKLNKLTVPELKAEGVDVQMIIDVRDEIVALKRTYEAHRIGRKLMTP